MITEAVMRIEISREIAYMLEGQVNKEQSRDLNKILRNFSESRLCIYYLSINLSIYLVFVSV